MFVNRTAWTSETGATWAAVRPIWTKNWSSSVESSLSVSITVVRLPKNSGSSPSATLIDWPRPASASPKPVSAARESSRRSWSKVFRKSSNSTGSPAFASGIVSPGANVDSAAPGVSSTYFRPSAERGRTSTWVSVASGSTTLSRLMSMTATERVSPSSDTVRGVISSTVPTRKPPTRTSLPDHQVRPRRHLRLQVVGGHEREPLVRVVGEEDRHHDDQHRDGADQHRARDDGGCSASGHGPRRKLRSSSDVLPPPESGIAPPGMAPRSAAGPFRREPPRSRCPRSRTPSTSRLDLRRGLDPPGRGTPGPPRARPSRRTSRSRRPARPRPRSRLQPAPRRRSPLRRWRSWRRARWDPDRPRRRCGPRRGPRWPPRRPAGSGRRRSCSARSWPGRGPG